MIRETPRTKERYRVGDRIRIRPKFTHLYPGDTAVIVAVVSDPIRSLFNEYTVEFPDDSMASLFQFQIFRDESTPT
jgi:hypothetical protein